MTLEERVTNWIAESAPDQRGWIAVVEEMRAETRPNGPIDPGDPTALGTAWNSLAMSHLQRGAAPLATAIYESVLEHLLQLQRQVKKRYHKGMILHNLGLAYLTRGQRDVALWYHRLAFVEDALSRAANDNSLPEAPATTVLRAVHGVPEPILSDWLALVGHASEWSGGSAAQKLRERYPELAVVEMAFNGKLRATPGHSVFSAPLNRPLLDELDSLLDAGNANERGASLEYLTAYLCLTLPGARIRTRVRTKIGELDLVVTLRDAAPSYFTDELGRTLLVECKNWSDKVGVQEINHLAARVRLHGCRTGIMLASKGVSGTREEGKELAHGQLLIQGWYSQDGISICVVDREDVRALGRSVSSFEDLIVSKHEDVRLVYSVSRGT